MNVTMEESRLIDGAWRGAEAYHFLMLAHRHLYAGKNREMKKKRIYKNE